MILHVHPSTGLRGSLSLPGDKSISHRAALLAGMASGISTIQNFLRAGVTEVMLDTLAQLGVSYRFDGRTLIVASPGILAWKPAESALHCGHSGTTMRLLAGALAAAGIQAELDGSSGLRKRPMGRIVRPLQEMGVQISGAEGDTAPLRLNPRPSGNKLQAKEHELAIASAQVKSAILLAALGADGDTVILEPGPSRDHTERMFSGLGLQVERTELDNGAVKVRLTPPDFLVFPTLDMSVPGDVSSAAFLVVAGLLVPNSDIKLRQVGTNPTRTGLLDALGKMGGEVFTSENNFQGGEPVADFQVVARPLRGANVGGDLVVRMIDEFPIFAVAAAAAEGATLVTGAEELRYKETDRITVLCTQLQKIGVQVEERQDGFRVEGAGQIRGGVVDACGDHRLAMALAVAGLVSEEGVTIHGAGIFRQSYPGFVDDLKALGADIEVVDA